MGWAKIQADPNSKEAIGYYGLLLPLLKGACIICDLFSNQNILKVWFLEFSFILDVNFQRSWTALNSSKKGGNSQFPTYWEILDLIHSLGFVSSSPLGQLCHFPAIAVFMDCHTVAYSCDKNSTISPPLISSTFPRSVWAALTWYLLLPGLLLIPQLQWSDA